MQSELRNREPRSRTDRQSTGDSAEGNWFGRHQNLQALQSAIARFATRSFRQTRRPEGTVLLVNRRRLLHAVRCRVVRYPRAARVVGALDTN